MEVLGVFLVAGLVGAAVWWFFIRKDGKESAQPAPAPAPAPAPGGGGVDLDDTPPMQQKSQSFEVADLEKLTKAEIEALGKEHGVALSRSKSKAKMIDDLRTQALK